MAVKRRTRQTTGPRSSTLVEEREEVEQLYRVSVEQNEVLAQQNVLLKSQVEKMQAVSAQCTRRAEEEIKRAEEHMRIRQEKEGQSAAEAKTRMAAEAKV